MIADKKHRIVSLDIFRGITIAAMVLVNNPGSWNYVYAPLLHASWNGCTLTDLVFPFFLFITGFSISIGKKIPIEERQGLFYKIFRRSCILFALGLFLNALPYFDISTIRIPGVLQRIAIVYLFCAVIYQYASLRSQIIIILTVLIGYYLMLTFIPIPGTGYSSLEKGLNLPGWLDNYLLNGHLWNVTKTWDPEGILSTLPAIISGLIGVVSGIIFFNKNSQSKLRVLLISSFVAILISQVWALEFPLNKNLWTSSYVLFTSGIALGTFLLIYWVVDVKKLKLRMALKPFQVMGTNAITAYVLSSILAVFLYSFEISNQSIQEIVFNALDLLLSDPYNSSLSYALMFSVVSYFPLHLMFRNQIFIKI